MVEPASYIDHNLIEMHKLAAEFKKLYPTLCYMQVRDRITPDQDSTLIEIPEDEIIEVLKADGIEKGTFIGIVKKTDEPELASRIPVGKLHIDLATCNLYLPILEYYANDLRLLKKHLSKNPRSKILEMFALLGMLDDVIYRVAEDQCKNNISILECISDYGMLFIVIRSIFSTEYNRDYLDGFGRMLISSLDRHPLDPSLSPRSETDLHALCEKDKKDLGEFYITVIEQSLSYLFIDTTPKPYHIQVLVKCLRMILLPYSRDFDWQAIVGQLFIKKFILPYLEDPIVIDNLIMRYVPMKKSPRIINTGRLKTIFKRKEKPLLEAREERMSRSSNDLIKDIGITKLDIEKAQNLKTIRTSGGIKSPGKGPLSPSRRTFEAAEIYQYLNDLIKIFEFVMTANKDVDLSIINHPHYEISVKSRYLTFVINSCIEKLLTPKSARPFAMSDYYIEICSLYEELLRSPEICDQVKAKYPPNNNGTLDYSKMSEIKQYIAMHL